jgi:hypothetical protein
MQKEGGEYMKDIPDPERHNSQSTLEFLFAHIDNMRESHEAISRKVNTDWYAGVLKGYMRGLFDRFCPFKVGDVAEITKSFDLRAGSGWSSSIHNLQVGAKGTIVDIDFRNMEFWYTFRPLVQTYFDINKKEQVIKDLYCFDMNEDHLGEVNCSTKKAPPREK